MLEPGGRESYSALPEYQHVAEKSGRLVFEAPCQDVATGKSSSGVSDDIDMAGTCRMLIAFVYAFAAVSSADALNAKPTVTCKFKLVLVQFIP